MNERQTSRRSSRLSRGRIELLLRVAVQLAGLRLRATLLGRALQPLERVRNAVMELAMQPPHEPVPPPGREREVSAESERAAPGVDGGADDPIVADNPEREGRAEPDLVPLLVHIDDLAVDPPPPAQSPGPAREPLAGCGRADRLDTVDGQVKEP